MQNLRPKIEKLKKLKYYKFENFYTGNHHQNIHQLGKE